MQARNLIFTSLAAGLAAVSVYFASRGGAPKVDLGPYDALGAVVAEETAKLVGNQGRVLVMARATGADKNPSVEAELKAFQETLKQSHVGVDLVRVQVTPMLMMSTGGGVPLDQLFRALETHTNSSAVVLFFALPQLTDPEIQALKKSGVKTVVVSSLRPAYKQLLERQAIHLAIVPRTDEPSPGAPPRTLRERFNQEYLVLTPADAARLR